MSKTVAELLVELKTIGKRIEKATSSSIMVAIKVGNKIPTGYKDITELETQIKANYKSATDLIKRRQAIKSALVVSNATTKVTVGNVEMTVAEAIEFKTSIEHKKMLLNALINGYRSCDQQIQRVNADVKARLDQLITVAIQKDSPTLAEDTAKISENFKKDNEATLVNPLSILAEIERLGKEIEDFEAEVDLKLSASNAVTSVEID